MKLPRKWKLAGPGLMIPVFFLSSCDVCGQEISGDAITTAMAGCHVTRWGSHAAGGNQAALGWEGKASLSLHHGRPCLLRELGTGTLAARIPVSNGGFGISLSVLGIPGMQQYSSWIGYGLRLGTSLTAGMGLYFSDLASGEYGHRASAGCALGMQFRLNDHLMLGGHVRHPVSYTPGKNTSFRLPMTLSAGMSYGFFETAKLYAELQASPAEPLCCMLGTEVGFSPSLNLYLGFRTGPPALSGGISVTTAHWLVAMASTWHFDTGITPACSLRYEF